MEAGIVHAYKLILGLVTFKDVTLLKVITFNIEMQEDNARNYSR